MTNAILAYLIEGFKWRSDDDIESMTLTPAEIAISMPAAKGEATAKILYGSDDEAKSKLPPNESKACGQSEGRLRNKIVGR